MPEFNRTKVINIISTVMLIGYCIGIYYHFVVNGIYLGKGLDPHGFLCCPEINFNDLTTCVWNSRDFMPYTTSDTKTISVYFPFAYMFLYPLSFMNDKNIIIFGIVFSASLMLVSNYYFLYGRGANLASENLADTVTKVRNLFIFSFLSYPFLYLIDRLNIDFFVFFFYIAFYIAYSKQKYTLAASLLAAVTGMKLFPGVMFLLFLKDKKYKTFITGCVLSFAMLLIPLILMPGSLPNKLAGLMYHFGLGQQYFGTGDWWAGIHKSFSLFGLVKLLFIHFRLTDITTPSILLGYFGVFTVFVGVGIFIYLLKYENELWKIMFILVSYSILFNYTSFTYRSITLFLPLWIFINSKLDSKYYALYAYLFAFILIPMQYKVFVVDREVEIAAITTPIIILIMGGLIIYERLILNSSRLHNAP